MEVTIYIYILYFKIVYIYIYRRVCVVSMLCVYLVGVYIFFLNFRTFGHLPQKAQQSLELLKDKVSSFLSKRPNQRK